MSAVIAYGAYLPRLRLERATVAAAMSWMNPGRSAPSGARAVCNWDEDTITMAVAAARRCIASAGPGVTVDRIVLASTTLPFADRSNSGLLAAALALDGEVATADVAGSQRCASSALIQALNAAGTTLLVASERRQAKPGSAQELEFGAGAVALLLSASSGQAQFLGSASLARDFVDHHRSHDSQFDYVLEERWVRDEGYLKLVPQTIKRALENARIAASEVRHFVCPTSAALAKRIAQSSAIAAEAILASSAPRVGELGAAQAAFGLALALEAAPAGEVIVMVGFGQGVDALVLRAGQKSAQQAKVAPLLDAGVADRNYVRYLSHNGLLDVDFGMRAERDHRSAQTVSYRRRDALTAFVGGRCERCSTVQFPLSRVCVNPQCRETDTQKPHRLAESSGRVKTFTEDWQAYSPRPPYIYGNVSFVEGGNLFMEFTDLEPGQLKVDMPVRFAFRIKDIDRARNFRRYFWKAIPAE